MEKQLYTRIFQVEQSHWWYVARRKIIFDWVYRLVEQNSRVRILDVGCGTGYNVEYMQTHGYEKVYGLDIAPDALNFCIKRNLTRLTCGDLTALPYSNEVFDMVMALDIVEHLEDDQKGINELSRILKPGGSLIIFVPAFQFLWSLQDDVSHHYRRYTAKELSQGIRMSGLEIVKLSYANSLLFPLVWIGRILLKLVRKRVNLISEADLSPPWSNGILEKIFSAERSILHWINFPVGVSILCVCQKGE